MIQRLKDKLDQQRRYAIDIEVDERNLDCQLFLRAMGFKATGTIRKYHGCEEYVIDFTYSI